MLLINARDIKLLEKNLLVKIKGSGLFVRNFNETQEFLTHLFRHPVISATDTAATLNKPYNSIKEMIKKFEQIEVLHKYSVGLRNKTYKFSKYIELLESKL